MSSNGEVRTQKFAEILDNLRRVIVLYDHGNEAHMHEVVLAVELLRRFLEQVPSMHIEISWQPWLGRCLLQIDIKAVEYCRRAELAAYIHEPETSPGSDICNTRILGKLRDARMDVEIECLAPYVVLKGESMI